MMSNATSTADDGDNSKGLGQPDVTPDTTQSFGSQHDNNNEEEEIDLSGLKDDNNLEVKKEEPNRLAGGGEPGKLDQFLDDKSSNQMTRDSAASHLTEVRELRTMAKQMDEQDRIAKSKAKVGLLGNNSRHGAASTSVASSIATTGSMSTGSPIRRGLALTQEKKRVSYLETGMQPGAYPAKTPTMDDVTTRMEISDHNSDHNRYLTTRRYNPQTMSIRDIGVEVAEQQGRSFSNIEDCSTQPSNIEEGHHYQDGQPLVEAFVVPDEEVGVVPPPVKTGTTEAALIKGDRTEKPQLESGGQSNNDDSDFKKMFQNMQKMIVCLFMFVIVCVAVGLTLAFTLPSNSSDSSSSNSQTTAVNPPMVSGIPVTMIPTEAPLAISEEDTVPPVIPPMQVTLAPTSFLPEGAELVVTLQPSFLDPDPVQEVATLVPTTSPTGKATEQSQETPPPTDSTEPPIADEVAAVATAAPTASPTEATEAPTLQPTLNPTSSPTNQPEESVQAPPPTFEPTSTLAPVSEPGDTTASAYANSINVAFTVIYTVNAEGEPSAESQAALDSALLEFFSNSLETGLDLESQTLPQAERIVSSEQNSHETGWWQNMVVEYGFGGAAVPPLQMIVDSFVEQSNVDAFLMNEVRPIGPYFANTNAVDFEFELP